MGKTDIIRIAIADDHEMLRQSLTDLLTTLGYEVLIAVGTGDELLKVLKISKTLPHVCILDINMPGKSARLVIKEVKKAWPSIKVLVFSVNQEKTWKKAMLKVGADFYLQKGVHPQLLHETIQLVCKTAI